MALNSNYQEQLRRASSNLIYAWISKNNLKYLSDKYRPIITKKRANQLQFMQNVSRQAECEMSEVTAYVEQCIREIYGMSPADVVYKLACGETVKGKNWSKGVFGIGAIKKGTTAFGDGSNYSVNPKTGDIYNGSTKKTYSRSCNIYQANYEYNADGTQKNMGSVYLEGKTYYDKKSNTTYSSILNDQTGLYEVRAITTGDTRVASDGNAVDVNKATIWQNTADWVTVISSFLEKLLAFFGVNRLTEDDIKVNQVDDGFEPEAESGISKAALGIIGGVALLALLAKDRGKKIDTGSKKKRK